MNGLAHSPALMTAASLLAAGLAACGGSTRGAVQPSPAPASATEPTPVERARADSARHPYTAADIQFMSGMIPHHAQAIAMARWAPTHGAGPSVRILAERILNAQEDEIITMQNWLRDRLQPVPEASPSGMKMTVAGHEHEMLMPGMLTQAQMTRLDQARGTEFDRLFLNSMIQHHRGAVSMVEKLFGSYGAGQDEVVFKFASDVNVDQSTEIARMERMLAGLPPEKGSP
jgi:uncharacterized protein (DUF305 family)